MNMRKITLVLLPVVLFIILAITIDSEIITRFEERVYIQTIRNMSPGLTCIMKGFTHIGDSVTVITICIVLLAIPEIRRTVALPVSMAVVLSTMVNTLLKHIFVRSRPDIFHLISETGYSFPSGHAMNNAALYTMLTLLIFRYIQTKSLKIILITICIAQPMLIGLSRVYLGVHYAGDILGGWMFGFALSMFIYFIWDKSLE